MPSNTISPRREIVAGVTFRWRSGHVEGDLLQIQAAIANAVEAEDLADAGIEAKRY